MLKFLKKLLFFILFVIAIALIAALFVKKELGATRDVIINRPVNEVWDYVVLLKNQQNYSKWATLDSNMTTYYKGQDGTVGFVSGWKGNKGVGSGEQEIIEITPNKRIDYELRFIKPMKSTNQAFMILEPTGDSTTRVLWGFEGKMNYPFNLMQLFINLNQSIGDDFEYGLGRLKKIMEQE